MSQNGRKPSEYSTEHATICSFRSMSWPANLSNVSSSNKRISNWSVKDFLYSSITIHLTISSISYSYSSSSLKKHYLYARNLLLDSFLPPLRIGDTFSRSGSREKNGGRRKTRGGAIWRARVSVHYPRPKYEYKSGWIRVHTMYFWRAFHPESS